MRQFKTRMMMIAALVCACAGAAVAGQIGPDVIVGDLYQISKYGTVGDITGYAIGTESCNVGDENLLWIANTNDHPVIAQNMYRLKNGRFEQIGMSWLKHGFAALALDECSNNCQNPGNSSLLGVNCSDPYSAGLNADQDGLGPRSEVNADSGAFLYPFGTQGQEGNAIYKRIQVHNADIDPTLNPGARYFIEGQYVTPDDAAAGNQDNNASYREVLVDNFQGGGWNFELTGQTQRESPAVQAWQDIDPSVEITDVDVPDEGRFILGSKCSNNGDGTWHYAYTLFNMNSDRSADSFTVATDPAASISKAEFHDVDYHSGEPYDLTDWSVGMGGGAVDWTTDAFDINPDANALRWGTSYSYRFDADIPPAQGDVTVGLFKPGTPDSVTVQACAPVGDEAVTSLAVSGSCPGQITLDVTGATPDGTVILARSFNTGTFVLPFGQCQGTELGLAQPRVLSILTADPSGNASFSVNVPGAACGISIQAIDMGSCATTAVQGLP